MAKGLFDRNDINDYQNRLTEEQKKALIRHCNRYEISPIITAWYDDWEDFCSDWCGNLGYTKTEARKILHGGKGEFKMFKTGEIVRLAL